jgi:hypothetical protein
LKYLGQFETFEKCAVAKAQQKNLSKIGQAQAMCQVSDFT